MKHTGTIALIACIAIAAYLLTDKLKNPSARKIGVVQMEKLVYDFKGMKEATQAYSSKMTQWKVESDSLENKLKQLYSQIRVDSLTKDQTKLSRDIKAFLIFKKSYTEYAQNMQQNAANEDKQMTLGVINQVNEYMKLYAQKEGYDVILCNSQQQSVGYAKEQTDVTQEILEFANKHYDEVQ